MKYHIFIKKQFLNNRVNFLGFLTNINQIYEVREHDDDKQNIGMECFHGPHYHIVCDVKFGQRDMRDWTKEGPKLRKESISPLWLDIWKDRQIAGIKCITTDVQFKKTILYVKKYKKAPWTTEHEEVKKLVVEYKDAIHTEAEFLLSFQVKDNEEYDEALLKRFRKKYPKKCDWRRLSVIHKWSLEQIRIIEKLENDYWQWQETSELTEALNQTEELFAQQAFRYYKLIRQKQIDNGVGAALIFGGESKAGKSVMCELLASQFKPYHKWMGQQFAEKDPLKLDDAVRAQVRCIVVEEAIWSIPSRKIDATATLHKIKEMLQDELRPRVAKNRKNAKYDSVTIDTLLFSFNPSRQTPYELIEQEVANDPSLNRRIIVMYFNNLFEKAKKKYNLPNYECINLVNIKKRLRDLVSQKLTLEQYMLEREKLFDSKSTDLQNLWNILNNRCEETTGDTFEMFMEDAFSHRMAQLTQTTQPDLDEDLVEEDMEPDFEKLTKKDFEDLIFE